MNKDVEEMNLVHNGTQYELKMPAEVKLKKV